MLAQDDSMNHLSSFETKIRHGCCSLAVTVRQIHHHGATGADTEGVLIVIAETTSSAGRYLDHVGFGRHKQLDVAVPDLILMALEGLLLGVLGWKFHIGLPFGSPI